MTKAGQYLVRVRDAIGVIGLGDLQIVVKPKIPLKHFLFLIKHSTRLPRNAEDDAELEPDKHFFFLIARWFLNACQDTLRKELARDYQHTTANLTVARGRVHALTTTQALLAGRPKIRCSFDDFGNDTPLNRLLNHALRTVQRNSEFPDEIRRRARQAHARFNDVGEYHPSDLYARTDARTKHYRRAAALARLILIGRGMGIVHGGSPGSTFLFYTPEAIEDGIRHLLRLALAPDWDVKKKGRQLPGAKLRTLNPDLVFNENEAIGDIKYRLSSGSIERRHMNQVTTFAAGYKATRGLLVEFGRAGQRDHVRVGDIRIDTVNWNIAHLDPAQSAEELITDVRDWLSESPESANP
ncbi:MAG: hypothetical protein F4Y13_08625 [Acidimicrobiaceae bacterium]|nr:hypothetical protein [Acidimicrobiaceae bacterium]